MPQRRQNPALYYSDGALDLGFVPWFSGPGWHDGGAVMLRHLVIGSVQIRLVAASASDAGARIVRHDQLHDTLVELESAYVTVDPVSQALSERRVRECVTAGAQGGNEDGGGGDFAGLAIVNRDRISGPVHKHLFTGLVVLPHRDLLIAAPALEQLTKTAIAVSSGMGFAVFFPDQLQRQMLMRLELLLNGAEVDSGAFGWERLLGPRRKQKLVQPLVIAVLRQRPTEAGGGGSFQVAMHARLSDCTTAGDLILA